MTGDDDRRGAVEDWCRLAGFEVEGSDGVRCRVVVDEQADLMFDVDVGLGADPLRVHDQFRLETTIPAELAQEAVEAVVLGRSAMIDGRIAGSDLVETVVAVYPDGLNRHTFMTAVFEIQKVRTLIAREADRLAADAATVAELERLVAVSAQ